MPDAIKEGLGLGFYFEVDSKEGEANLKSIGKVYNKVSSDATVAANKHKKAVSDYGSALDVVAAAIERISDSNKSSTKSTHEYEKVVDNIADALEDYRKRQHPIRNGMLEMGEALRKNAFSLDKLGISWGGFIRVLEGFSIGGILSGAVSGIFSFFKAAVEKANEFGREIAKLNETMSLTPKQMQTVSSTIMGFTNYAGFAREEIIGVTKSLLDMAYDPETAISKLGISFRSLTKEVLNLSGATGISTSSASDFYDQMVRINRIPATNLRGIGSAIKFIADKTKITSDELVSFHKSLDPIFAYMISGSKEATTKLTVGMTAVAGKLSEVGIDASRATSEMADMLNDSSDSGIQALYNLANTINMPVRRIRELILTDPAALFDELAQAANNLPTWKLQQLGEYIKPLGLNFVDLKRLGQISGSFSDIARSAEQAAKKGNLASDAAMKRQTALDAAMKALTIQWDNFMISIGGPLAKLTAQLMNEFLPTLKESITAASKLDWSGIFSENNETLMAGIGLLKGTLKLAYSVFSSMGKHAGIFVSTAINVFKMFWNAITGNLRGAKEQFRVVMEGIGEMIKTVFYAIPNAIDAALGTSFGLLMDVNKEAIVKFGDSILDTFESLIDSAGKVGSLVLKSMVGAGKSILYSAFDTVKAYTNLIMTGADKIGTIITAPFEGVVIYIMEQVEKLIIWLSKTVAPKLKDLPGMKSLASSLAAAGEAVQISVAEERETIIRERTARELSRSAGSLPAPGIATVKSEFPNQMITTSPTQESLLRDQNGLLQELVDTSKQKSSYGATPETNMKLGYATGG